MSDQSFFLPLADVRQEVQRFVTVNVNENAPVAALPPEVIYGGSRASWANGAWLECQEAPLADGSYAIRVRWWRPSMPEPCAQSWTLSPWCAPASAVTFPGELVKGEARASAGELTWAEVRDQGLTCDRHMARRVWCGCRAGQGGLSTAEALGASADWAEAMERVVEVERPKTNAETVSAPSPTPVSALKGGSGGGGEGSQGFVDGSVEVDAERGVILVGKAQAPAMKPPTREVLVREVGDGEWDEHVRAKCNSLWVIRCDDCQRRFTHDVVPDSVCQECGGEVELCEWPDLEPNARALETIGQLEQVVRRARKAKELAACQVCCSPIREGGRYLSPPKNSPRRRIHALCVEALARVEGPV